MERKIKGTPESAIALTSDSFVPGKIIVGKTYDDQGNLEILDVDFEVKGPSRSKARKEINLYGILGKPTIGRLNADVEPSREDFS